MPLPLWLGAAIPAAINTIGGLFGAHQQKKSGMELAKYQYSKDLEMLRYQNEYNSPASQMARYKEAGLNPNLIYGQGSSGNMQSAPQYPSVETPQLQQVFGSLGTQYQQARLMSAQADLTQQKVSESGVKQDLMRAQENLVKANPYLNTSYVQSMVSQMESIAEMKKSEAHYMPIQQGKAIEKITMDLRLLEQRFNLSEQDKQIKAKIIESKQFENAMKEVQMKWLRDGSLNAEHVRLGLMMLMQKLN